MIHSELSFEKYGFLELRDGDLKAEEEADNWREMAKLMVDERLKRAESTWNLEKVEPELRTPEEEWFKFLPKECTPVLYHSDNRLENLLIDENVITAFLDWAKIRTDHNLLDLTSAGFFLIDYELRNRKILEKDKLREKLYEGYEETQGLERNSDFGKMRNLYRYLAIS